MCKVPLVARDLCGAWVLDLSRVTSMLTRDRFGRLRTRAQDRGELRASVADRWRYWKSMAGPGHGGDVGYGVGKQPLVPIKENEAVWVDC